MGVPLAFAGLVLGLHARRRSQAERGKALAAILITGAILAMVLIWTFVESVIAAAEFPSERRGMRENVAEQRGWLVLSPRAEQVVVKTGHAVEEEDPQLVIDTILEVVRAAR